MNDGRYIRSGTDGGKWACEYEYEYECMCIGMVMRYTTMGMNYANGASIKQPFKVSDQAENDPKS